MTKEHKADTSAYRSRLFKFAIYEILRKYAKDGDHDHAINRLIELIESESP